MRVAKKTQLWEPVIPHTVTRPKCVSLRVCGIPQ